MARWLVTRSLLGIAVVVGGAAGPLGLLGAPGAHAQEAAAGQDWPWWRGPSHDGHSAEAGWLAAWPKLELTARWERQLGAGYSAVSVVGARAYTMGYMDGKDVVYCLDTETGKPHWGYSYAAENFTAMNAGGPSATPTVADGKVYTLSRDGQLHCFAAGDGKLAWRRDLAADYKVKPPSWGLSGSVLARGDRLYIDVGVILALDAKSGKEVWKTKSYGEAYSTPVAFTQDGTRYLAVFPQEGLVILREDDGRHVAQYGWKTRYGVNAATPVLAGDGHIFIASGYGSGGAMVRFDGKSLREVWKTKRMEAQMATCVYHEGYLYGFDDTLLTCLDAKTGAVKWQERRLGKGALMMSRGKLIVMGGGGDLLFADASPEGFKPVFRRPTLTGGDAWTVPVLAHGRVYCRDPRGRLVCLEIEQPSGARSGGF